MTGTSSERLYQLLPAIFRIRDLAHGEQLRALLGILEEELSSVEDDVARLYDNCFIETCDEWVVPYIGDLVSARLLHAVSQRAFTANTLAYRRRKGTLQTLGAVARDVTGWPARAVEYMQLVAMMQNINSARPDCIVIPNLQRLDDLSKIGTPFERTARTVSVRSRGKYHLNQVGLYLWRLGAFPLERVRAVAAQPGCFYINPLAAACALWNPSESRPDLAAATESATAPQPLRRLWLYQALESRRQALVDGRTWQDPYFDRQPVLQIYKADAKGQPELIPTEQILVADLTAFARPPSVLGYRRKIDRQQIDKTIAVAVDPELGRLAFPSGQEPAAVWVSYYYGYSAELGGGGYERPSGAQLSQASCIELRDGDPGGILSQLADPAAPSSPWAGARQLILEIADSDTYVPGAVCVPAGGTLVLRARNWQRPLLKTPDPAGTDTPSLAITLQDGATLILEGLLIAGALAISGPGVAGAALGRGTVTLTHCTLVPGVRLNSAGAPAYPDSASIFASGSLHDLVLNLDHSITGTINLTRTSSSQVSATDSIIDAAGSSSPALSAQVARLARVTVLGSTVVDMLSDTTDTLFNAPVTTRATSSSSVRYSYVPTGSQVAAAYRCQPELALSEPGVIAPRVRAQVKPWFVSRRYGTPGYAQLDARCAPAIRNGGSVEGEMGALQSLYQAQREANLIDCKPEYLRFGISMNLFLVT